MDNDVFKGERLLLKKRIKYPPFKMYGNLSVQSLNILKENYIKKPTDWDEARALRIKLLPEKYNDDYPVTQNDLINYHQLDIQYRNADSERVEYNYINVPDTYIAVYTELKETLRSEIYRMRYATIEVNDDLLYHIDQPGKDRFIVVIQGEQYIHMRVDDKEIKQHMLPGEIWYLNSNWPHKIENVSSTDRIALLGCFDF